MQALDMDCFDGVIWLEKIEEVLSMVYFNAGLKIRFRLVRTNSSRPSLTVHFGIELPQN